MTTAVRRRLAGGAALVLIGGLGGFATALARQPLPVTPVQRLVPAALVQPAPPPHGVG